MLRNQTNSRRWWLISYLRSNQLTLILTPTVCIFSPINIITESSKLVLIPTVFCHYVPDDEMPSCSAKPHYSIPGITPGPFRCSFFKHRNQPACPALPLRWPKRISIVPQIPHLNKWRTNSPLFLHRQGRMVPTGNSLLQSWTLGNGRCPMGDQKTGHLGSKIQK